MQENSYYQPIQINSKKKAAIFGKNYKNSPSGWFDATYIIMKPKGLSELTTINYPFNCKLDYVTTHNMYLCIFILLVPLYVVVAS